MANFCDFCDFCVLYLVLLCLTGCSAPKEVVEHHHHYSEVDTMAVQAQVDKRLAEVKELVVRDVMVAIESQQAEQSSQEQEKERVTETITTWVDSLGREMRQEQRTTERDISRQLQMRVELLRQEYEKRMWEAMDSMNSSWKTMFDSVQSHSEEADSASVSAKPTPADNRPWWKRWFDCVKWMAVGAVLSALLLLTRKMWKGWLLKL